MIIHNSEEYNDPILYDQENNQYMPELAFLLKWASQMKGPMIDVACGTGRMTIPLAEKGHKLIGVDIHKGMLDEAANKSANLGLKIDRLDRARLHETEFECKKQSYLFCRKLISAFPYK